MVSESSKTVEDHGFVSEFVKDAEYTPCINPVNNIDKQEIPFIGLQFLNGSFRFPVLPVHRVSLNQVESCIGKLLLSPFTDHS